MPEQFKEGRHELTTIFLGRLILSAMFVISLKAFIIARSELLIVLRFWYFEFPNSSKLAAPVPWKEKFVSSIIQATSCSLQEQTSSSFIRFNSRQHFQQLCKWTSMEVTHSIEHYSHNRFYTFHQSQIVNCFPEITDYKGLFLPSCNNSYRVKKRKVIYSQCMHLNTPVTSTKVQDDILCNSCVFFGLHLWQTGESEKQFYGQLETSCYNDNHHSEGMGREHTNQWASQTQLDIVPVRGCKP